MDTKKLIAALNKYAGQYLSVNGSTVQHDMAVALVALIEAHKQTSRTVYWPETAEHQDADAALARLKQAMGVE